MCHVVNDDISCLGLYIEAALTLLIRPDADITPFLSFSLSLRLWLLGNCTPSYAVHLLRFWWRLGEISEKLVLKG